MASGGSRATDPSVVAALWRGLNVLRPVALLYAVYSLHQRHPGMERPWVAAVVLAVLAAWTGVMWFHRDRTTTVVGIELALAVAAVLSTRVVDSSAVILAGAPTVPGIWPSAAVVSWAVLKGWRGGLFAAAVVSAADVVEVVAPTDNTVNNIVLLFLVGGCIGYCADLAREGHLALREALRVQAQVQERDRLARTVHDGVLQTLAFIHRRSADLGGPGRELGAMAADQERLLRALVSGVPAPGLDEVVAGDVDLRQLLGRYAGGAVQVVPPADPVPLPRKVAEELSAAVSAALDNVRRHAGDGARAWVLVEDEGRDVVVTVRDDGVGLPAGRLVEAAAHGRLGVRSSITGRLADLGGSARYESHEGEGTAVELRVPRKGRSR